MPSSSSISSSGAKSATPQRGLAGCGARGGVRAGPDTASCGQAASIRSSGGAMAWGGGYLSWGEKIGAAWGDGGKGAAGHWARHAGGPDRRAAVWAKPRPAVTGIARSAPCAETGQLRGHVTGRCGSRSPRMSTKSSTVTTRFAPSPTGYIHVGNLRTALMNYLIARQDRRHLHPCGWMTPIRSGRSRNTSTG
jgi:hypothetical protein